MPKWMLSRCFVLTSMEYTGEEPLRCGLIACLRKCLISECSLGHGHQQAACVGHKLFCAPVVRL